MIIKTRDKAAVSAYISLGCNQGDCGQNLAAALEQLAAWPEIELEAVSGVYRTEPQGDLEQPWFFNQAARLGTMLEPLPLLRALQEIENRLGRVRDARRRFGPRVIDLDLLDYAGISVNEPELILPHPRMPERAFVLAPLLEVARGGMLERARIALGALEYVLDNDKIYQNH